MHRRRVSWILVALAAAFAGGCGAPRIPGLTPYKMDIQQGNFVSQEMASQLKPGMSKEQVRFILGTPLVTDIFHTDRWDYIYWREAPDGKREQRKLAVFFAEGKLVRLDGDIKPAGAGEAGVPPVKVDETGAPPVKAGGEAPRAKLDMEDSAASVGSDVAPAKAAR